MSDISNSMVAAIIVNDALSGFLVSISAYFWPALEWFSHTYIGHYFLKPGLFFWHSNEPTGYVLLVLTLFSLEVWLFALRVVYWRAGRVCGWGGDDRLYRFLVIPGWRPVFRLLHRPVKWSRQFKEGKKANARFTGFFETMSLIYKPRHLYLGSISFWRIRGHQPIGKKLGTHGTMFGAAGAGKSTLLARIVSLWQGSVLGIDVDAAMINALRRRLGQGGNGILGKGMKVCVFDPYGLSKTGIRSTWNVMRELDRVVERHKTSDAVVRYAQTIAEALVREDNSSQPFFSNAARTFIKSLVIYVWAYEKGLRRNLVRVRDLLTRGLIEKAQPNEDAFKALLREMKTKEDFEGVIARGASIMESAQGIDGKNHPRATAIQQTDWLDIPEACDVVRGRGPDAETDIFVDELKDGTANLFLVAPVSDIRTKLSPLARLLLMWTFYTFENLPGKPEHHCLVIADECPSAGRIPALETGPATMRKYGLQNLICSQDITALADVYPTWSGMVGNSEVTWWLPTDHKPTLEYLVQILGKRTRKVKVDGSPWWKVWGKRIPARYQVEDRELMDYNALREFLNKTRGNMLVTRQGERPIKMKNDPYYTLPVYLQEADTGFGENILRRKTRAFFARMQQRNTTSDVSTELTNVVDDDQVQRPPAGLPERRIEHQYGLLAGNGMGLMETMEQLFNPAYGLYGDTLFRTRVYRVWLGVASTGGNEEALRRAFVQAISDSGFTAIEQTDMLDGISKLASHAKAD